MIFKEMDLRRGFVLVLIIALTSPIFSQIDPLTSMYWNNYSTINPANTGLDYKHFYSIQARDQWTGVEGNPQTLWVMGDVKTKFLHGGLGFYYINDQVGNFESNRLALNYSFQILIKEHHELAAGIFLEAHNLAIKSVDHLTLDPMWCGPIPPEDDATIGNIGLGLMYKFKKFKVGFSARNLNEAEFNLYSDKDYIETDIRALRHYYLYSSHRFNIFKAVELQPSFLYRYRQDGGQHIDTGLDVNMNLIFKENYWIGVSYRITNLFILNAGVEIFDRVRLAYSYDLPSEDIQTVDFEVSHELSLSFLIE